MSQDVLPSTPLASSSSSSGQAPLVVGLDLGGTKIAGILVTMDGRQGADADHDPPVREDAHAG